MSDSVSKASFVSLIGSWLNLPLGIIVNIAIARTLGPEPKGQYAIFLTTLSLLLLPAASLSAGITFFVAQKQPDSRSIFFFSKTLVIAQATVSAVLLWMAVQSEFLNRLLFSQLSSIYILVVWIFLVVNLWYLYKTAILSGMQLYTKSAVWGYLGLLVANLVFLAFLVYWWTRGTITPLDWVIVVQLISLFLGQAFLSFGVRKVVYIRGDKLSLKKMATPILLFSLPILLRSIVEWVNLKADVYVVNAFSTARDLGIYTVAVGLAQQIWTISNAVAGPLFAKMSKEGASEEGRQTARQVIRIAGLSSFVFGVLIACLSPFCIPLVYGKDFKDAVPLLIILMPGVFCLGATRTMGTYLSGIGMPQEFLKAEILGLVSSLGLNLLLTPRLGSYGAATASCIAYICISVRLCARFRFLTGSTWSDLLTFREDWVYLKARLFKRSQRA